MWTVPKIMRAYRVDDERAFRAWLKANDVRLPIADRMEVKRLVGAYRRDGGR